MGNRWANHPSCVALGVPLTAGGWGGAREVGKHRSVDGGRFWCAGRFPSLWTRRGATTVAGTPPAGGVPAALGVSPPRSSRSPPAPLATDRWLRGDQVGYPGRGASCPEPTARPDGYVEVALEDVDLGCAQSCESNLAGRVTIRASVGAAGSSADSRARWQSAAPRKCLRQDKPVPQARLSPACRRLDSKWLPMAGNVSIPVPRLERPRNFRSPAFMRFPASYNSPVHAGGVRATGVGLGLQNRSAARIERQVGSIPIHSRNSSEPAQPSSDEVGVRRPWRLFIGKSGRTGQCWQRARAGHDICD